MPVTSFELTLPEGQYSALAANGNLCKRETGDADGVRRRRTALVIKQSTKIAVTGCPKPKAAKKKAKKAESAQSVAPDTGGHTDARS